MIDWFRGEIPLLHDPLPAGRVLSIEPDGSIAWECSKSIICRSSHETSLKIKSAGGNGEGRATSLFIDGNLAKFLQGHNVFGTRDLNTLLLLAFRAVYELQVEELHDCSSPQLTEAAIKKGNYKVKMLDINQLYGAVPDPAPAVSDVAGVVPAVPPDPRPINSVPLATPPAIVLTHDNIRRFSIMGLTVEESLLMPHTCRITPKRVTCKVMNHFEIMANARDYACHNDYCDLIFFVKTPKAPPANPKPESLVARAF